MASSRSLRTAALPAALASVLAAAPLDAQEKQQPSAVALEEVIVTARKQEERLLDVPLAITALTSEQIEARGIRDLEDVAAFTPGLTLFSAMGEFLPTPVIRGVAPTDIFGETNAAIFLDGVYISGREGLNFSQIDMERIEVVKGPQAALYGRNAFSGAINYVTKRPTDEFEGKIEAQLGSDEYMIGQVSLSGPLIKEKLRGRIALLYDNWDGSYDNTFSSPDDIGGHEYKTVLGSLLWAPTESFDALLSLYVSDDHIGPPAMTTVETNCENQNFATPTAAPRLQNFCGELQGIDGADLSIPPQATGEERDVAHAHLTLQWDLGPGTVSALSGYARIKQKYFEEFSRSGVTLYEYTTNVGPPGAPSPLARFGANLLQIGPGEETTEFSQELRFSSDTERSFRYSVGAYFYNVETESRQDGHVSLTPLPADFRAFCPCAVTGPPSPTAPFGRGLGFGNAIFLNPYFTSSNGDAVDRIILESEREALSGFFWLEQEFAARWTARAELRYTNEDRGFRDLLAPRSADDSWDYMNWRTSLSFKPDDGTMWYGSVAHAEKSGGFATAAADLLGPPRQRITVVRPFDPEEITAFELGVKTTLADGRVQGDLALFYNDWKEIVIPQVFFDFNGQPVVQPYSVETNGGDASVKGVEPRAQRGPDSAADEHARALVAGLRAG